MQRLDKGNIEQSIIGNRFRELLHTTAVILTYTDSDAKDEIVEYLLTINDNLYT